MHWLIRNVLHSNGFIAKRVLNKSLYMVSCIYGRVGRQGYRVLAPQMFYRDIDKTYREYR